jgi:urease alpha subunit
MFVCDKFDEQWRIQFGGIEERGWLAARIAASREYHVDIYHNRTAGGTSNLLLTMK